ncbi:hypothetical protein E4U56_006511 [Claviceps arundinis]|uniref:Pentatricopeptide repeat protein n=1 Tax=Claviceps arundinis TaxID=1623583 RepID=A0A9P7SQ11_9HYPO|nr:hypothetical protein E4U56_006511 [Claviceps arundinis]
MSLGIRPVWRHGFRSIATPRPQLAWPRGLRSILSTSSLSTSHGHSSSNNLETLLELHDVRDHVAVAAEPYKRMRSMTVGARKKSKRQTSHFVRTFRETSLETQKPEEERVESAYVPVARQYPKLEAASLSRQVEIDRCAHVQAAFDKIWKKYDRVTPTWEQTMRVLKRMNTKHSGSEMAAIRVSLPPDTSTAVGSKRVEFMDSTTGTAAKLRIVANRLNPSSLLLRGKSAVIASAAEELSKEYPGARIFKLGHVSTLDLESTQLWPPVENAVGHSTDVLAEGVSSPSPPAMEDGFLLHEESRTYWIDEPYEKTPKPSVWTKESFETYVKALVRGKLRPHLAMKYYRKKRMDGHLIDTEGIRVRMIMDAFEDPSARECITLPVFKLALGFMAMKGGHRALGDQLFALAEEIHLPMDTEVFNIMLEGYAAKRDVIFFHQTIQRMEMRCFVPNARTWLIFLGLVQRGDARRQIISNMYELGLFSGAATQRGIARVMASDDAYAAFRAGKTLEQFLADQTRRYGQGWFTTGAKNAIIKEFMRFDGRLGAATRSAAFLSLVERPSDDGQAFNISTPYTLLEGCIENGDWRTALWTLTFMQAHACETTDRIYSLLFSLAFLTRAPSSLGVLIFYAILERKLRQPARRPAQDVLLRRLLHRYPVKVFSASMAELLRENKVGSVNSVVAGVEWAILKSLDGYEPMESLAGALTFAWRGVDLPSLRRAYYLRQKEMQEEQSADADGAQDTDRESHQKTDQDTYEKKNLKADQRANQNLDQTPDQKTDQNLDQTLDQKADQQADQNPDQRPEQNPDQNPDQDSDQTPDQKTDQKAEDDTVLQDFRAQNIAITFRDKSGQRPPLTVRLDTSFDPDTMLRSGSLAVGASSPMFASAFAILNHTSTASTPKASTNRSYYRSLRRSAYRSPRPPKTWPGIDLDAVLELR